MKRSGPPKRKTPLRGTSSLRRKRTLLQRSAITKARRRAVQPVVDEVFQRDGGCVLRTRTDVAGKCFGHPTPHHLRKQSQLGRWTVDNLVTLCAHHNGWVEDEPRKAWGLGLVVRQGESYAQAWAVMRNAGLAVTA